MAAGGRALKLLSPCIRASSAKIVAGLTCACIASAVTLSIPWTIKLAIDDVFSARTIALSTFVAALLVAYVLRNAFVFAGRRIMLSAGEKTSLFVRRLVFQHLQSLSTSKQSGHSPGQALSRVTGDVSQIEGFIETGIPKTICTLLIAAGALVIIFVCNPMLAAVSLAVLPLHLIIYIGFKRRIKSGNRRMREDQSGLSSVVVESLLGGKAMAASTAEDQDRQKFFDRANDLLDSKLKLGSMRLWQKAIADVVVGLGTVAVWYYGGRMVIKQSMQPGEFTAFLGYLGMLYPLSLTLMAQMSHTLGTITSAERIMDLLETDPEVSETSDTTPLTSVRGEITFDDATFSYNNTSAGIRHLNARIMPGEVVAITGPVGTGKSTLGYLLARFYDLTQGTIHLDGVELGQLPLQQVRGAVGIVFQEPFLFSDTIANNIRYSKPDAGHKDVSSAAEAVGLGPMLQDLPDGLETAIGEGGIQLSLGEKRRIDMARALLKDPPVMVLDSVFAEGDTDHQLEEEKVFAQISRGRTTFVINPPSFILQRAAKVIRLHRNGSAEVVNRSDTNAPETTP